MKAYDIFMKPLELLILDEIRKNLMPQAQGKVLEIGFATGVNMKYYNFNQIESLDALDVHDKMTYFDQVTYHVFSAEDLPFEDESFDSIVMSLALCSIPDPSKAILEIKRILKPQGQYFFIEHEQAQHSFLKPIFNFVNPLWNRMTNGCNINRESHKLIESLGFQLNFNRKGVFTFGIARKM